MVQQPSGKVQRGIQTTDKARHTKAQLSKDFTHFVRVRQRKEGLSVNEFCEKYSIARTTAYDILSGQRGSDVGFVAEILDRLGYEMKYEFVKKGQTK